jgi:HEAT repeat protein
MEEEKNQLSELTAQLNSDDPTVRRETAEKLLSAEINSDVIALLVSKLTDDDTGVRDAVCMTLTYNENGEIPEFVVPFIAHEEISVRNLAGDILIKRGVNSIDALVGFIEKGNDDDKKFIIDILALIGDPSPKDSILKVLAETQNENVALACIEAMGSMKVEESIDALIKVFDENELYRPTVVESFGKIGSPRVLEFVLERYDNVDDLTRFSMMEALGELGTEETFFFLLSKLKGSQPPLTWAIITSLKKLRDVLQLDIPFDENTKNAVLTTLVGADLEYQKAATSLLTYFKDSEVLDACLNIYGKDPQIDEDIEAIFFETPQQLYIRISEFLQQRQHNIAALIELLKKMIEMDNGQVLSEQDALIIHNICERLSECLTNPAEEVRRTAMELLFFIAPEQAFVFIDTMATDTDTWNKLRLIEILENFQTEEATTALKTLANDPEDMIRQRVEFVLSQRGNTD